MRVELMLRYVCLRRNLFCRENRFGSAGGLADRLTIFAVPPRCIILMHHRCIVHLGSSTNGASRDGSVCYHADRMQGRTTAIETLKPLTMLPRYGPVKRGPEETFTILIAALIGAIAVFVGRKLVTRRARISFRHGTESFYRRSDQFLYTWRCIETSHNYSVFRTI